MKTALANRGYWWRYVPYNNTLSSLPVRTLDHSVLEAIQRDGSRVRMRGMLHEHELAVLYGFARDVWTGAGEIVDTGCFYGLTSFCLARGVSENSRVHPAARRHRIYAFDLFRTEGLSGYEAGEEAEHTGSFFQGFLNLNRTELDYIVPVPGDVSAFTWSDKKPIELLMIDAAKGPRLMDWHVEKLFPRLIPNVSLLVQQDYMHFAEYWVPAVMELYSDHFDLIEYVYGASATFCLKKPFEIGSGYEPFAQMSFRKIYGLLEAVAEKSPRHIRPSIFLGLAKAAVDFGDVKAAHAALDRVEHGALTGDPVEDFSRVVEADFEIVKSSCDALSNAGG